MADKPLLILQMLRMGDLILSFPLFLWIARVFPGRPIWVVGEPAFFRELVPLSPQVTYFPWSEREMLSRERFHMVLNLSHRREAADLAGSVRTETVFGPVSTDDGLYIHGQWQLYRASLVENNRHNLFHWADLNALDIIPHRFLAATRWSTPRTPGRDNNRVGVFIGASERSKRPGGRFWTLLIQQLLKNGLRPVLLGGPSERNLAREILSKLPFPILDMTGKLSLSQLAKIIQTLQLMITPDTGPMHLAAWCGVKVLNLSMGPVNPWETGPYQPGHFVARPGISCSGCWSCPAGDLRCTDRFSASRTARMAVEIVNRTSEDMNARHPGIILMRSGRDLDGLYALDRLSGSHSGEARLMLSRLWHSFWKEQFGAGSGQATEQACQLLKERYPELAEALRSALHEFIRSLHGTDPQTDSFWRKFPPLLRPLSGYAHLTLQNSNYAKSAFLHILHMGEYLSSLLHAD